LHKAVVLGAVVVPFLATVVAIVQLWQWAVSWSDLILLVALYTPISLGVTAGFHRMLTHRSFRAHPVVRGPLLVCGTMAVQGPAITRAANHLKHHALADEPGDPHSPMVGLFWHWAKAGTTTTTRSRVRPCMASIAGTSISQPRSSPRSNGSVSRPTFSGSHPR
jgi:fatty-acid desaturase